MIINGTIAKEKVLRTIVGDYNIDSTKDMDIELMKRILARTIIDKNEDRTLIIEIKEPKMKDMLFYKEGSEIDTITEEIFINYFLKRFDKLNEYKYLTDVGNNIVIATKKRTGIPLNEDIEEFKESFRNAYIKKLKKFYNMRKSEIMKFDIWDKA